MGDVVPLIAVPDGDAVTSNVGAGPPLKSVPTKLTVMFRFPGKIELSTGVVGLPYAVTGCDGSEFGEKPASLTALTRTVTA